MMTNENTGPSPSGCSKYSTETERVLEPDHGGLARRDMPVVIGFLLLQRYLVAGLTAGAVK